MNTTDEQNYEALHADLDMANTMAGDALNRAYNNAARIDYLETQIAEARGQYEEGGFFTHLIDSMKEDIKAVVIEEVTSAIMKRIEDCVSELGNPSSDKEFITDIERLLLACQQ